MTTPMNLETAYDLRAFIDRLQNANDLVNELQTVSGAHWDIEIGALSEILGERSEYPALLFDDVPGYPRGYRVISNILGSPGRDALAFGLPPEFRSRDLVKWVKSRLDGLKNIPPREVKEGPVMENVVTGKDVNVLKFPVPRWHEQDGGRYIGTYDAVICRDPDSGYVNIGTYRVQVHDERTVGVCFVPGKHGEVIAKKYWAKGEACPFLVVCGVPPALLLGSSVGVPFGMGEYDFLGGLLGEPMPVVISPRTGLPMPATAEIVLEGVIPPPSVESRPEGPFGEWPGYYASEKTPSPILKVEAIYHRDNPIITGFPCLKTYLNSDVPNYVRSANIWSSLERAGVPDVRGVWFPRQGRFLVAVAIAQKYPGHARQAAYGVLATRDGGRDARIIVVVDEDIDITNINELMWAICSRWDPGTASEIVTVPQSQINPRVPPEKRESGDWTGSCIIIDACRPYSWRDQFPPVTSFSAEQRQRVSEKFAHLLTAGNKAS